MSGLLLAARAVSEQTAPPSLDCPVLGVLAFLHWFRISDFQLRRLPTVLLFLAVPFLGPGLALRAQDTNALFAQWLAAQTNMQTWSADLVQTRSLKALSQPLTAKGKVWIQAPDRFRWELGQPAQTIALRQPEQMFIIYPRLKRAEKYPLTNVPPGPWKDALALLDASFPRDRAAMEERFSLLSANVTNALLQVTLQPKSAAARKFITQIQVTFHTNDFSLAATEMTFADGSAMRNDFANGVLNQPVDPALFEPKLGPDFTVVEPLRR